MTQVVVVVALEMPPFPHDIHDTAWDGAVFGESLAS